MGLRLAKGPTPMVIRTVLRRPEGVWQPAISLAALWRTVVPAAIVLILFKLAISDGGRHLETLGRMQIATFLVVAVVWIVEEGRQRALLRGIGVVLVAIAITSIGSVRIEASVRQFILWMMYGGIAYVIAASLAGPRAVERLLDGLTIVGGWLCLIALFMFWGGGDSGLRWYSTFYWPNPFAAFLLLFLPLSVARAVGAGSLRGAGGHLAMSVLLAVSLIFTYSRGAWVIGAITVPLAVALCRPRSWRAVTVRAGVFAAGVTIGVVLLTHAVPTGTTRTVVGRAASIADLGDGSIQGRLHFWRSALKAFADHPLTGTGPGTFEAVHAAYQRDARFYSRDPHNLYVQIAAEMGLAGLAAGGIVLAGLLALWREAYRRAGGETAASMAGIGAGLVAFLLHSGVDMDWSFPANPAMAFALAGVVAAMARPKEGAEISWRQPPHRWLRGAAVVLLVLASAGSYLILAAHHEFAAGREHARAGRWTQAAQEYGRAIRLNPLKATYRGARAAAFVWFTPPDVAGAEADLQRAIDLDRMNATFPLQMGRLILERQAEPSAAVQAEPWLHGAIALDPLNRPEAYRLLGQALQRQSRLDEAEQLYRRALVQYLNRGLDQGMIYLLLWPEVVGLAVDAAELAVSRGEHDKAAEALEALLTEDPNAIPAAVQLSSIYVRLGRRNDAHALLMSVAARHPDHPEVKAALDALR